MYEARSHPPIPRRRFVRRMVRHAAAALALLAISLAVGMAGYEHFERLPWRDAFLNAAMLMGGMGPVDAPQNRCRQAVRRALRALCRAGVPGRRRPALRAGRAPPAAQVPLGTGSVGVSAERPRPCGTVRRAACRLRTAAPRGSVPERCAGAILRRCPAIDPHGASSIRRQYRRRSPCRFLPTR